MSPTTPQQPLPRPLPHVFWWLWFGMLVNSIGAFTLPFLAYFLARDLHLRPVAIGGILAGFGAGSLTAALNAGWITDGFGLRRVLLASQLVTAAATGAFAFVRDPVSFALIVVAFGIAINVPNPVLRALVADVVPSELQPLQRNGDEAAGRVSRLRHRVDQLPSHLRCRRRPRHRGDDDCRRTPIRTRTLLRQTGGRHRRVRSRRRPLLPRHAHSRPDRLQNRNAPLK
jgi:hypothetical protein